jgi:hypothetical protein
MPLLLAIEPDHYQASQVAALARGPLAAELVIADSAGEAIERLANRVPDLILTSQLLSPKDEALLTERLHELDAAGRHVQTLVIPVLTKPSRKPRPQQQAGLLKRLQRKPKASAPDGCDPAVFGAQIAEYLERAMAERGSSGIMGDGETRETPETQRPKPRPQQAPEAAPGAARTIFHLPESSFSSDPEAGDIVESQWAQPITVKPLEVPEVDRAAAPPPPFDPADFVEDVPTAAAVDPILEKVAEEVIATAAEAEMPEPAVYVDSPLIAEPATLTEPIVPASVETGEEMPAIAPTLPPRWSWPPLEGVDAAEQLAIDEPVSEEAIIAEFGAIPAPVEAPDESTEHNPVPEKMIDDPVAEWSADLISDLPLNVPVQAAVAEPTVEPTPRWTQIAAPTLQTQWSWPRLEGLGSSDDLDGYITDEPASLFEDAVLAELAAMLAAVPVAAQDERASLEHVAFDDTTIEPEDPPVTELREVAVPSPSMPHGASATARDGSAPGRSIHGKSWSQVWSSLRLWPRLDGVPAENAPAPSKVEPAPAAAGSTAASPPTPPAPGPEVLEMLTAIRHDIERLRAEQGARPASSSEPADKSGRGLAKAARSQKTKEAKESAPVQDEWGFFDPDRCGFAALLDKLEEITETEEAQQATRRD